MNEFGIYIHIPYCLQRCSYCDFATYKFDEILPPDQYVAKLRQEIRMRSSFWPPRSVDTIYFGGGTPSLISPNLLKSILQELEEQGWDLRPVREMTIEINPATITHEKMEEYLKMGVNRFSVGAQTFKDSTLKYLNREHDSQQTRETLRLLQSYQVSFSMDLLFALPHQSLQDLEKDLDQILKIQPQHISPYCLTVPHGHRLQVARPSEEIQVKMFDVIATRLLQQGYEKYEISNFARPGYQSQHNLLYWSDSEYWGLGLSAHSYQKRGRNPLGQDIGPWGQRFWNPSAIGSYVQQMLDQSFSEDQLERLELHQSVSDYCHTHLRVAKGIDAEELNKKFGTSVWKQILPRLQEMLDNKWIAHQGNRYFLTDLGILLSNQVFQALTFLEAELDI